MGELVLFIDSEPNWLEFAKSTVDENGYQGLISNNLKSAEELFSSKPGFKVALVVIDISLLKENDSHFESLISPKIQKKYPVVAVFPTGVTTEMARVAFKAGVSDCVDKPYDPSALMALVEQMFAEVRISDGQFNENETGTNDIIIVEDDDDWMESLLAYLPKVNSVEKVQDYKLAVEKILSRTYDLAVLDLRLVDSNEENFQGMDLVHLIRNKDKDRGCFTQIIIVSAFGTPDHIRDVYGKYKVYYYFDKRLFSPVSFREAVIKSIGFTKDDLNDS
jgi:DNA-binding response OmpR family regulator